MKYGPELISAGLAVLLAWTPCNTVLAATLRVGGTGAVSQMLRQLAPAFESETGITLEVVPSLGTSGANKAVAAGVLGMAIAGRDLNAEERSKGLSVAATFRTPFGLATSRKGPDGLKSADIAALYRAAKPVWPDGKPILVFLRPVDESDNIVLGQLFPGMEQALAQARGRSDLSVAATDQDNADLAEKTPGSLIGITLTQVVTEKRQLRLIAIDGIAATLANYENGSYRSVKTIYLVVPSALRPETVAFVAFLGGATGRSLLREAGIVTGDK